LGLRLSDRGNLGEATFGTGYYFRQQHEHLLVARRGEVPRPPPEKLCSSVIRAPRPGLHSAKPKIMYDIIERMYPGLRKIELFARGPARPGWTNWGLEAGGKEPINLMRFPERVCIGGSAAAFASLLMPVSPFAMSYGAERLMMPSKAKGTASMNGDFRLVVGGGGGRGDAYAR
jgi:hypothetical protein